MIYYIVLYKRKKDLMYRFGWKKEYKIFYYSEFLGNRDKIDEDMITPEDKNKYEKDIEKLKKQMDIHNKFLKELLYGEDDFIPILDKIKNLKLVVPSK